MRSDQRHQLLRAPLRSPRLRDSWGPLLSALLFFVLVLFLHGLTVKLTGSGMQPDGF